MFKRITLSLAAAALVAGAAGGAYAADYAKIAIGSAQKEFPESVTSTADGTLFTGSIMNGQVYKAAPGATSATPFITKPADGPGAILGVFADEKNNNLWACYADTAIFAGKPGAPSVLRSYDIKTGAQKTAITFPENSVCNDITAFADGSVLASDTTGARIIHVGPGATTGDVWLADPQLAGIDGISLGPDGQLYVNSVSANKLFKIAVGADRKAGAITELTPSEPIKGPDGMRWLDGKLYVAENANGRIDEVAVDGTNAKITPVPGPTYDGATAMTKVGSNLYVLETKRLSDMHKDPVCADREGRLALAQREKLR